LEFVPSELQNEEVPQQLQVVGELCAEQGSAFVSAMGDTIVYTVNPRRTTTDLYTLKVLTVVASIDGSRVVAPSNIDGDSPDDVSTEAPSRSDEEHAPDGNMCWQKVSPSLAAASSTYPEAMMCSVGSGDKAKIGLAGHVALTYASGGQLVTSMGHWIELSRINTSEEELLNAAQKNFGDAEWRALRADLDCQTTEIQRDECRQKWAKSHISKSVPTRMKCRTKFDYNCS
jgi:hypothetical protein